MMKSALKLFAMVIALIGFHVAPSLADGTLSMTRVDGETVHVSLRN